MFIRPDIGMSTYASTSFAAHRMISQTSLGFEPFPPTVLDYVVWNWWARNFKAAYDSTSLPGSVLKFKVSTTGS